MIKGDTVLTRKTCLAHLVKNNLISIGESANIIENRTNSRGHTDRVLVDSSVGLVHVVASVNDDPQGSIPTSDFQDSGQDFLIDKDYVAYGWNTKDKRTIVMFVPVKDVLGNKSLSKSQISSLSVRKYNFVIRNRA